MKKKKKSASSGNPSRKTKEEAAAYKRRYYNPKQPGSFGGVKALHQNLNSKKKVARLKVEKWLSSQDTYTLHKPVRHRFPRRRIVVGGIDHQWQADLVDLAGLSKQNDGFKYLLTCIDVFSKYAWVVPLRDKTGKSLVLAFENIFQQGRKPRALQTDKGGEFTNRPFQTFLKENEVSFFTTQNEDIKASIVERFNRTLKTRMWRYFTRNNTSRYLDVLKDLVHAYNKSFHRSIKMTPLQVNNDNSEQVWQNLYGVSNETLPKRKLKFQPGDRVRISKVRRTFKKGYLPNWSEELFTVVRHLPHSIPPVYILMDDQGDVLEGTFYAEELQKVASKEVYLIERVLQKKRQPNGQVKVLVRWLGYPASFDSWIDEKDLLVQHKR